MYNYHRNVNFHLPFFLRHQLIVWPLTLLFLLSCPRIVHSLQNINPDRTVAKLGPRQIQLSTTPTTPTNQNFNELYPHILYVISLDGKITAIDAQADGRQIWTTDTGTVLVDSSLSKIEISRDSRSVRLIPSLIGGLYEKYDEDGHIEPLPFDADALLDASFKLHEELVITGGKHIDTLGLDLHTGQVLYSFAKDNVKILENNRTTTTNESTDQRSTLIVKRTTQTVRARSARNGYEKWNFSVSNHELLHLRSKTGQSIVVGKVDEQIENTQTFTGYFEYQLQTGVVVAFDQTGHRLWSSAIHAPIAAVWELKNGELVEKSLFETTKTAQDQNSETYEENEEEETNSSSPPIARRLAFIGEFNSTPYVLIPPRVQKELILDARKNNIAGTIGYNRPILSSWHKAYQKRTLSIGYENDPSRISPPSTPDSKYPLALRPDPTMNPNSHLSSLDETCDTAGYLELIDRSNVQQIDDKSKHDLQKHAIIYIPSNTLTMSTIFLGGLMFLGIWYLRHKQNKLLLQQQSISNESTVSIHVTPPPTPEYHQIEKPFMSPFQSRYTTEYDHVRFLGRGGFGVVFEAMNKLDERRVAIKRVSLKKPSGKDRALKEIRYLAKLNHPNLIQYYYAWNESPPVGWQEEEDKKLLVRNSINARDSMSTFPTSGNDSESIKSSHRSSISVVQPKQSLVNSPLVPIEHLFEITFDHSTNPLLLNEDFPSNSIQTDDSSSSNVPTDANNNTKHSLSSSSPLFDHSSSSSSGFFNEKAPVPKESTESDDGIVFLHEDQRSSSSIPNETKSVTEKKKSISNEKDFPPVYFYFVMELCQPDSLRDRLIQRTIDRQQAWSIFDQIVQGIEYIHSRKLIHRDLKPSNILFSLDDTVKIGDFGLVAAFGEDKLAKKFKRDEDKIDQFETMSTTTDGGGEIQELGGTILYMSPEQINREPYNQKVDIYAMGIILFELLYPFSTQMERMHSLTNVRSQTPVFPPDFERDNNNRDQLICKLIRWLLSYSPHDRPKASDLRQDSFYQRILHLEVPQLFSSDNRQHNQTMITSPDQMLNCPQRTRISSSSSSPFRRTVSSSALQSQIE